VEPTYLIQTVRDAFAHEEGELAIGVVVRDGEVCLSGTVPCEQRRSRLEALARSLCDGYEIVNHIDVRPPEAPRAAECLP
jgi:osmotically-inducible protein OsmY